MAKTLVDHLFSRFSIPEQLHSDQGRQFESDLLAEVCRILGIRKTRTTPYHPQCDGLIERFNRTLLDMLATTVKDHPEDWENHIRKVCMAYNTSVQATTGYTPFFLMFGRQARIPADVMFGTDKPPDATPAEHASALRTNLEDAFERVRKNTGANQQRQKAFYDRTVHGKPFAVGDDVWLHSPAVPRGRSRKLHHPWTGPWRVTKRLSDAVYRLQSCTGRRRRVVVHFDRLKRCAPGLRTDDNAPRQTQDPSPRPSTPPPSTFPPYNPVIVDDDEAPTPPTSPPPRYPVRSRHPPARYSELISC